MQIQTTIDLDRLRALVSDPVTATDEQLMAAAQLIPGTSIHFGQLDPHSNELREFSYGDLMLVSDVLHQSVVRGLDIPQPLITEV